MVPDPRKALVERLLDRLYPVTPNGRTGFAWKEYDATKAELLALLATDPTTLRAALEALVQKWSDEAISAMSNGLTEQAVATEWCASDLRAALATPAPAADPTTLRTALGLSVFTLAGFAQHRPWCPEAAGPADCTCGLYGLLDAIQCVCGHKVSVHTTRQVGDAVGWPCGGCKSDRCTGFAIAIAALATPAPAADEARCAFVGCGGVRDDVFHEPCLPGGAFHDHKACHPFQPAPTPAPPTPPATEEGPAVVVAHWGGDPDSCSLHGDIPRDVSPAEHVRELHAAEIDAWERVSIDGHPGWAEPTPPATEPVAALAGTEWCDWHGFLGCKCAAARAEVDVEALALALHDAHIECRFWYVDGARTESEFHHDHATRIIAALARRAGEGTVTDLDPRWAFCLTSCGCDGRSLAIECSGDFPASHGGRCKRCTR